MNMKPENGLVGKTVLKMVDREARRDEKGSGAVAPMRRVLTRFEDVD
jgi:hypothetical protein